MREVELLRLVLRFSSGMGTEERRAGEAVEEEEDEAGRGDEAEVRLSGMAWALEQAEPGLPGAGFRFGLGRVPEAAEGETKLA